MITLFINGHARQVKAAPDTPLLYVLRGELNVMTPKFGCGLAQCGACSVLVDGEEVRACIYPIIALEGKQITTVDGLPARWQQQRSLPNAPDRLHPVQQAWIDEQVPQCGICQYGMMIKATELLEKNPSPSDEDINHAMTVSGPSAHLCRCGSYAAIKDGIHRAAAIIKGAELITTNTVEG
ncbi:(2Fe-2S)-binding protein [Paraglaciecola chathamensis]|uniref:Probable xanthine dehydrogenase subunit E n=1 Tax=Paraglaciecola chathamensis S18K6 TaxID=1127672 RepID=A0AAV3V706_9ALTE|nr:(2Fe-2S)-binding protein [Paraglaciecola chathamensis]GAC12561.1 probable xanthine dehydrogenase subunit E [Paraglaciecola chathamensis S18K6]